MAWAGVSTIQGQGIAYIANPDGTNAVAVAQLPYLGSPIWSPDGTTIAFAQVVAPESGKLDSVHVELLDVASGAGVGSRALAAAGARAIPVDRMCYPGSTASLQASALELPVRTSWCDAAISVESASHLADRETFFAEVSRCLRPKARFVLADIVPDRDHQKVQEQLTRAGLVPVEIHDVTLGVVRALELRRQAFGHNGDLANFVAARVSAQELVAWNIDLDSLAVEAKLHRANRRMLERETLHYLIISCTRTTAGAD